MVTSLALSVLTLIALFLYRELREERKRSAAWSSVADFWFDAYRRELHTPLPTKAQGDQPEITH